MKGKREFISLLITKGYTHKIEGGKIIITYSGHVDLASLKNIPEGVIFSNGWSLFLNELVDIPDGTEFKNGDAIYLNSIKSIPSWVKFDNGGSVFLKTLKTIPPGVRFNNEGGVYLSSLLIGSISNWDWPGVINGIKPNRLLNYMISKGMFI